MIDYRADLSPSDSTAGGGRQLVDVDELTHGRSTAGNVSALASTTRTRACSSTAGSTAAGLRPRRGSSIGVSRAAAARGRLDGSRVMTGAQERRPERSTAALP